MAEFSLLSEISGRVWQMLKSPGDAVAAGEPVLIVEAMKMEIPIAPEQAATVRELRIAEGDEIEEGQVVAILEVA